jgi:hypothetical protein
VTRDEIKTNAAGILQLEEEIENLQCQKDDLEEPILRIAKRLGQYAHRRGQQPYFTRTSQAAKLAYIRGEEFHFDVYDNYTGELGPQFVLTVEQLANPDAAIERMKARRREAA